MNILDIDTVALDESMPAVVIVDQTLLPGKIELISLKTPEEIWEAIYHLKVRGAPAIGVCAAFGIYVLSCSFDRNDKEVFYKEFCKQKDYLDSSRPTAVNLSWALERMAKVLEKCREEDVETILQALKLEAKAIRDEDVSVCQRIGENGLSLVKPGDGILTHCNAGHLATVRLGTATAPIYTGHKKGYGFKVYADETRPLLQGARLTAFELAAAGVDVTLQCDNMSARLMKEWKIQAIFVGCDRVAANGDVANKIGTSLLAIAAKYYGVPFYVCAPCSTIDMSTATGNDIVIEQRKPEEVTEMWYGERMAPQDIKVFNPAFDVTDAKLISGIVTECGIARYPYTDSLVDIMNKKTKENAD